MAHYISQGIAVTGLDSKIRTVPRISPNIEKTEATIPEEGDIYVTKEDFNNCAGIIVGSPTRFGNMAAPLKYFLDQTSDSWFKGKLVNKPAAFFTSTSTMHGGQESTLLSMMIPFLHHGALIVGIPYTEETLNTTITGGSPYGATHYAGLDSSTLISKEEIILCKALGNRVGNIAKQIKY